MRVKYTFGRFDAILHFETEDRLFWNCCKEVILYFTNQQIFAKAVYGHCMFFSQVICSSCTNSFEMVHFPETFYFAIMTSYDGRARGLLLDHKTWMYSSSDAWCHWSSHEEEATIFKAEGTPDQFILEIYKSFKNRQGGSIVGRPTWVYNDRNTSFNYTSVKDEATKFKLISVEHGYILEILSSHKNRAYGTHIFHRTWMYNEKRTDLDGVGPFGYTNVQREATVFSIRPSKDRDEIRPRIVKLKFHMESKTIHQKPYQLFSATYKVTGPTPIEPTWATGKTKETRKTRSFRWNSSSTLTLGTMFSVSVEVTKLFATLYHFRTLHAHTLKHFDTGVFIIYNIVCRHVNASKIQRLHYRVICPKNYADFGSFLSKY